VAILIPEVPKACPTGERIVYDRLGRDLPDDWIVLHSLGLPGHETKIWGEADIVVLCTHGVFALEVKGSGKISCQSGVWEYARLNGESYTKKEDPWTQAKTTMMAVREALRKADPAAFGHTLFGYGVVMPFTTFTATGAEIVPEVLLDKRQFRQTLNHFVSRLERHWQSEVQQKYGRAGDGLSKESIRKARQILRPDLETALSIGGYLTGVEQRLLQLSNEQIRASRRMASNSRTVVRGKAGTGKSVIALERARMLSAAGKRVLYLCFNALLAGHVQRSIAGDTRAANIEVRHAHALYHQVIAAAALTSKLKEDESIDFFGHVFPQLAAEALLEKPVTPWDVLIIDEAQDLLTADHLDVFDLLLADGLERGCWHIFFDPLQNIYGGDVQDMVKLRLDRAHPAFEDLFENCRNTKEVALQASIISGIDLAIAGAPDGPTCDNVWFTDAVDFKAKLDALITALLTEDVKPSDIAILSTRKRENSLVAGMTKVAGRPLADAHDEAALKGGAIVFSTMQAFKGLERMTIIAIDMDEIGQAHRAMLHYAGLSRACGLLHTFLPSTCTKAYSAQSTAFGRRLQTAIADDE
jgi:hypothetical protein